MLEFFENAARLIRVFIELCVFVGILLLLYFLGEVIDFFPPSLTLGDAAKLALVSIVAASVHFVVVLANLAIASVVVLMLLCFIKWGVLFKKGPSFFKHRIDLYFARVSSTVFFQLVIFGCVLIWSFAFGWLPYTMRTTNPWIITACCIAFLLISTSYFELRGNLKFDRKSFRDSSGEFSLGVQAFIIGSLIALIAPVFAWGSFETFLLVTMTDAGLVRVPADLFIKKDFCGLVTNGFDEVEVREGFCRLKDVAVMFQGIGDKVLVQNFSNGFEVSLPADAVFLSNDGDRM